MLCKMVSSNGSVPVILLEPEVDKPPHKKQAKEIVRVETRHDMKWVRELLCFNTNKIVNVVENDGISP